MILVVGGLNGFVGSNTTEALAKKGVDCVVTQHHNAEVPRFLGKYIGRRVFIESADATSVSELERIGERHDIDGIVNVGGGFASATNGPVPYLEGYFSMLLAMFRMADRWKVKRVVVSSTGGVYVGLPGRVNEEQLLALPSPFPLIAYQKIVEIAASVFTKKTGIGTVCVRLMGMFGPWQDPSQGSLVQRLAHAAVTGNPADLKGVFLGSSEDEVDLCYIKDVGRAIALVQTAETLSHEVYNVGSGKVTPNREAAEAIERAVPGFTSNLPPGRSPFPPIPFMSVERLQADTGFAPAFDIRSAVRDYVEWLRAGNSK